MSRDDAQPEELLSIVREKLLEIQKRCGASHRRFALDVLKVSEKTYYNIRAGAATLDLRMLDEMARNLGVSVRVLVDAAPMPESFDFPEIRERRGRPKKKPLGTVSVGIPVR